MPSPPNLLRSSGEVCVMLKYCERLLGDMTCAEHVLCDLNLFTEISSVLFN
jgi:hypothetical protein